MTSYFSVTYLLVLLPIVALIYQMVPKKSRWEVLLGASYLFFWIFSHKLIIYILLSTFSIHHFGIWMDAIENEKESKLALAEKTEKKLLKVSFKKRKKAVMLLGISLNLGTLVVLKYTAFFAGNINSVLALMGFDFQLAIPRFMLPLGISFYTMQAASYLIDVYRGTVKADRNLPRLALYIAFFPQLMEGPICRYSETADQLWSGSPITYENGTRGLQRILYGCMKKMVIADQLNRIVEAAFSPAGGTGVMAVVGAVFYTCQLYMEFSGTIDVVLGSAEIFGVHLTENFYQPFFSRTVSEFWKRWHITLGTWFRDYVFYPVSMSKRLRHLTSGLQKKCGPRTAAVFAGAAALFCVWIFNGLWHGAAWSYIFFGMYHFVLILLGVIVDPIAEKLAGRMHIDRRCTLYRGMQIGRTMVLICIGEMFFRAATVRQGMTMFGSMLQLFSTPLDGQLWRKSILTYLPERELLVVLLATALVFLVDILKERKVDVRQKIAEQNIVVRWAIYYALIFIVLIFGVYGYLYVPIDPMYAQF